MAKTAKKPAKKPRRQTESVNDPKLMQLLESANEASRRCRTAYLTFLLVSVYFALIVGSTTDEQLLRGTAIALPILNVNLPIVGVYFVAPGLFLILHFNLLLNLFMLSRKLFDLDPKFGDSGVTDAADPSPYRRMVDLFPFSQYVLEKNYKDHMRWLLFAVVWITVVAVPVILLLWSQVRFLPYHWDEISYWHAALFLADLVMLWCFWPMMLNDKGTVGNWLAGLTGSRQKIIWLYVPGALTVFFVFTALFFANVPGSGLDHARAYLHLGNFLDSNGIKDGIRFRYLDLREKTLVAEEIPPEILAGLVARKAPPEEIDAARVKYSKRLVLKRRNLRGADLFRARLHKADLRGADLREAVLESARLQGADLRGAYLQGAVLREARLQGADLFNAHLQGADLFGARLQGADLNSARLQGADLSFAILQGAVLSEAVLQGAVLRGTDLRGAFLRTTRLQGAVLFSARLEGAELRHAHLQGADAGNSYLDLADLSGARLQGQDAKTWREMWQEIRQELEKESPAGGRRDVALERIQVAEKRVTRIEPWSAEKVFYNANDPLLAHLKVQWTPPKDWNREAYNKALVPYLVRLACKDVVIAQGITGRVYFVGGLATSLLEKNCAAVAGLPEGPMQKLRGKVEEEREAAAIKKAEKEKKGK